MSVATISKGQPIGRLSTLLLEGRPTVARQMWHCLKKVGTSEGQVTLRPPTHVATPAGRREAASDRNIRVISALGARFVLGQGWPDATGGVVILALPGQDDLAPTGGVALFGSLRKNGPSADDLGGLTRGWVALLGHRPAVEQPSLDMPLDYARGNESSTSGAWSGAGVAGARERQSTGFCFERSRCNSAKPVQMQSLSLKPAPFGPLGDIVFKECLVRTDRYFEFINAEAESLPGSYDGSRFEFGYGPVPFVVEQGAGGLCDTGFAVAVGLGKGGRKAVSGAVAVDEELVRVVGVRRQRFRRQGLARRVLCTLALVTQLESNHPCGRTKKRCRGGGEARNKYCRGVEKIGGVAEAVFPRVTEEGDVNNVGAAHWVCSALSLELSEGIGHQFTHRWGRRRGGEEVGPDSLVSRCALSRVVAGGQPVPSLSQLGMSCSSPLSCSAFSGPRRGLGEGRRGTKHPETCPHSGAAATAGVPRSREPTGVLESVQEQAGRGTAGGIAQEDTTCGKKTPRDGRTRAGGDNGSSAARRSFAWMVVYDRVKRPTGALKDDSLLRNFHSDGVSVKEMLTEGAVGHRRVCSYMSDRRRANEAAYQYAVAVPRQVSGLGQELREGVGARHISRSLRASRGIAREACGELRRRRARAEAYIWRCASREAYPRLPTEEACSSYACWTNPLKG
ncbi:hypothetical protein Emed_007625 [Eimeria media]